MRLTFVILMVMLLASALAAPVSGQEGGAAASQIRLSRGSLSATPSEMVSSEQGRYRQRGSAGDAVAAATLGAAKVNGSLGFWWRPTERPPVDPRPTLIYLPLIFK